VCRKRSTIEQEKEQDLVFFNKTFFAKNEVRLEEDVIKIQQDVRQKRIEKNID
jgi:hypothetical protein